MPTGTFIYCFTPLVLGRPAGSISRPALFLSRGSKEHLWHGKLPTLQYWRGTCLSVCLFVCLCFIQCTCCFQSLPTLATGDVTSRYADDRSLPAGAKQTSHLCPGGRPHPLATPIHFLLKVTPSVYSFQGCCLNS